MKTIIVPTDFTATADAALNYARAISDFLNARIRLIHVHSETADERDVLAKLDAQITMSGLSRDIITGEMVKGDYLKMIPKLVNDEQFGLIVFGTHGKKGVQHLVGSFAMRIVNDSNSPAVVVQRDFISNVPARRIFTFLDSYKDVAISLERISAVARKFKVGWNEEPAEIVIGYQISDDIEAETFELLIHGYMKKVGIPCNLMRAATGKKNIISEIVKYSNRNQIDLICLSNESENSAFELVSSLEQRAITNEARIPVMLFNPDADKTESMGLFTI
jgi:nucleotide-binding universal stress UspA family protein